MIAVGKKSSITLVYQFAKFTKLLQKKFLFAFYRCPYITGRCRLRQRETYTIRAVRLEVMYDLETVGLTRKQ